MTGLQTVSFVFHQAYQQRQTADYDTAKQWTRAEALAIIDSVDAAFKAWPDIRNHKLAQNYLLSFSEIPGEGNEFVRALVFVVAWHVTGVRSRPAPRSGKTTPVEPIAAYFGDE